MSPHDESTKSEEELSGPETEISEESPAEHSEDENVPFVRKAQSNKADAGQIGGGGPKDKPGREANGEPLPDQG